jgi:hypothetical protein
VAALKRRRFDDDLWDDELYEAKYYPRKVFKDGRGPNVPLYLTDSAPHRSQAMLDHQRLLDHYAAVGAEAARHNKPHQASLSDADVSRARSKSEHARAEWLRRIKDEFRAPVEGGLPFAGINGEGGHGDDDDDDGDDRSEAERARDQWIEETSRAWREPWRGRAAGASPTHAYGNGNDPARAANVVEAQRRRWTRESQSDSALTDKDAAYGEYCQRICNDWKR